MKPRRELVNYILLNIAISATVVTAILLIYHQMAPRNCPTVSIAAPQTSLTPMPVGVDIVSVQGAGSVGDEILIVQNLGSEAIVLTDWYLNDEQAGVYIFPQLTLFPAGTVRVHTGDGTDTASDLYWGSGSPAWSSGDLAVLYDAQDVARAFYRIP
jgi:hypothetical protein